MESPEAKVRYVIYAKVEKTGVTQNDFGGEWVQFEGSRESLWMPAGEFKTGDKVKISFEKE